MIRWKIKEAFQLVFPRFFQKRAGGLGAEPPKARCKASKAWRLVFAVRPGEGDRDPQHLAHVDQVGVLDVVGGHDSVHGGAKAAG